MMATTSVPYRPSTDHSNISLPLSSTSSDRSKPTGLPWAPSSNTLPGQSPCTSPSSPPHPSGDRVPRSSKPRRYKSQYPLESEEQHVEYILVASFHIDRGPIMEHQYPAPISGDESMLAELMLPDQTHMRSQDWTIFFLHKDTNSEEDELSADGREGGRRTHGEGREGDGYEGDDSQDGATDGAESSDEDEGGQGPPLMYVLNLVNTKQDNTVKRGAVVKAMAICTRHSFLHIYKPLLLLALDDYFKNPYPETLAALYESLNNMDLSLMPKLSLFERHILQDSASKDMFIEKFERMIQQRLADEGISSELQSPPSPKRIAPQRYTLPRDTHEFESKVIYNDIPVPVKVPTVIWPETVGDFSLIRLIQTFSASPPYPFPLHAHLTTSGAFTHPIIVLINAMLTQKRVVFLGHNRPSAEVAETVLAACALASSGILRGFTRHAFPYTDLTKIDDLLKVPGFVAGVTNPAFGNHPEWWDLLCDLSTGKVKISTHIEPAPMTEGLVYFQQQESFFPAPSSNPHSDPTGDNLFMQEIQHSITNRHGENAIRAKWRSYITKFTRVAAAFEEAVFGATNLYAVEPGEEIAPDSLSGIQTDPNDPSTLSGHGYVWPNELSKRCELAASVSRIEGWRNTRSYYAFIQDIASMYSPARCIKTLDLHHHHDRLRTLKLSQADAGAILIAFSSAVKSYGDICQLLIVTPESNAGLFYISMGLFHPDRAVREATVDLLGRIAVHPAGQHFWAQLGRFAKLAYFRIKRDRDIALAQSTVSSTELSSGEQQSLVGVALGNNRRS